MKVKAIGALTVKDADTANPKSESVQPDSRTRIENDTKHTNMVQVVNFFLRWGGGGGGGGGGGDTDL